MDELELQGKPTPFSSPLGLGISGVKNVGTTEQVDEETKSISDRVIFEKFKHNDEEKGDFISPNGVNETENSVEDDMQDSRKRRNPFDSQDPNPLIRALAVRTMGCIRVDKITEYLCDPLQRCLKDDDPYVRKTAAICVAKLYDINAELVEDRGFLESFKDLISDNNPMVVANAVAALAEIQENSSKPIFEITSHTLSKLLTALNECTDERGVGWLKKLELSLQFTPFNSLQCCSFNLELPKEKIEWVQETAKKFKRLRCGLYASKQTVIEDEAAKNHCYMCLYCRAILKASKQF